MELNPEELNPDLDDTDIDADMCDTVMYDEETQEMVRRWAANDDFIAMLLQSQREVEAGENGYSVEETIAAMYAILNGEQPPEIFN